MTRSTWFSVLIALSLGSGAFLPLTAQNISRTITIDGDMSDWYQEPNITMRPGQSSTDCDGRTAPSCDLDYPVQSTGRDLRTFAYTWDKDHLYFFVERYGSANNVITWLFYMDENLDGKMQTGERFFAVRWHGSNRSTGAQVCAYIADLPAGDTILGDGHTLPGRTGSCTHLYAGVRAGSVDGLTLEAEMPWSSISASGPKNLRFHVSSALGLNLPTQVIDNMDGPGSEAGGGGGELFPANLELKGLVTAPEVNAFDGATLVFSLRNVYFQEWSEVQIGINLPPLLSYVSHVAPPGTRFVDTDSDGVPDRWEVDYVGPQDSIVLAINIVGSILPHSAQTYVSGELLSWSGEEDMNSVDNADSVMVIISASPDLVVAKFTDAATALPGQTLAYTTTITNTGDERAWNVYATSSVDANLFFRLNTFGPGQHVQFVDGTPPSGLVPGAIQFSADGGGTWTYTPSSGAGGASEGYDGNITHWRIPMSGIMNANGASFEIRYQAQVR